MHALDWTGNHFLDPGAIRRQVRELSDTDWDPTRRTDREARSLKQAIADHFALPPGWIAVASGSAAGIDACLRSLGDIPIIDAVPNFHQAATVARRDKRRYIGLPTAPGLDPLASALPFLNLGAVLVLASPSNPFGIQTPLEALDHFLPEWQGVVLLDEAYADFAPRNALALLARHPNLVISRTFSKAWGMADLRIGFLAGQSIGAGLVDSFLDSLGPSRVAADVASHLLRHPSAVQESIRQTLRTRTVMAEALRAVGFPAVEESSANYLAVRCERAGTVLSCLQKRGLRVKRLSSLRDWPVDWPDGFRVSVCPPPVLDRLLATLAEAGLAEEPDAGGR
jgi:histidinol-phosphate aminotransferase